MIGFSTRYLSVYYHKGIHIYCWRSKVETTPSSIKIFGGASFIAGLDLTKPTTLPVITLEGKVLVTVAQSHPALFKLLLLIRLKR